MTTTFKEVLEELQSSLNRWVKIADSSQFQNDKSSKYKGLLSTIDSALEASNKPFQVFVKNYTGKTYTLDIYSNDSVPEIKSKIEDKLGVSASEQRLLVTGKQLDDNKFASDYRLEKESTIHLVLNLRGGGKIKIENPTLLAFSPNYFKFKDNNVKEVAEKVLQNFQKEGREFDSTEHIIETVMQHPAILKALGLDQEIETLIIEPLNEENGIEQEKIIKKETIKVENPTLLAFSPNYFKFKDNNVKEIAEKVLQNFQKEGREFDSTEHIIETVMQHPAILKALGLDEEIEQKDSIEFKKEKKKIKIETLIIESPKKETIKVGDNGANPSMLAYSPKYFEGTDVKETAEKVLISFKEEGREFDSIDAIIEAVNQDQDVIDETVKYQKVKQLKSNIIESYRGGDKLSEYDVIHGKWERIPDGNKERSPGDYQLVVSINHTTYAYHLHTPDFAGRNPIPGQLMINSRMSGTQTSDAVIKAILKHKKRPTFWDQ